MTSVLIVDDDAQLREAMARDLKEKGFDVTTASCVSEATTSLGARAPDVLITDLRMSEADGIDLLDSVRNLAPQTRSILMSAYATARDHQVATDMGAVRVLCKPFNATELVQAIQQAVDCGTGFRVLRPGGRLSISDIVTEGEFSPAWRSRLDAWAACVSGAIDAQEVVALMREAGFVDVQVADKEGIAQMLTGRAGLPRIYSARITGYKPA